MDVYFDFH
jgi:hypothetical protein